jgi:hypothetical protein
VMKLNLSMNKWIVISYLMLTKSKRWI